MNNRTRTFLLTGAALAALPLSNFARRADAQNGAGSSKHVLLISVDGLHALDLARYVRTHPGSAMARLSQTGTTYTQASCSRPSDSFPGLLALVTGGSPNSTGVWYDASYDRTLLPPTAAGGGTVSGTPVVYDESIDKDSSQIDGGGGIDPTALPRDPKSGQPVYPHSYLRVNTIFEVAKSAHLHTAWCDKHPAYDLVNGPSGAGVDDLYTPEIAAPIVPLGGGPAVDPATALRGVEANDELKVAAVLNEIDGKDHTGTRTVGVPAVFGMNFQSVSVGEKVAKDALDGRPGGYLDGSGTPTPLLSDALDYVDSRLGRMVQELTAKNLLRSTVVILTAKHGQAPMDIQNLQKIGNPIDPAAGGALIQDASDDVALLWLNHAGFTADEVRAETESVVGSLRSANGSAGDLGIAELLSGDSLKLRFNDPLEDPRVPDVIVLPKLGVIYTHSGKKIAEHGGFSTQDTNVALLISNPSFGRGAVEKAPVQTTQVAPTIVQLLGLNPSALQAVRLEHTEPLPGLSGHASHK